MKEETRDLVEKRKEEIRARITQILEKTYMVEIFSFRSWRLTFDEGEHYWRLVCACEEEKNLAATERLMNFFRDAKAGFERRVRDVGVFYIPFLIALLIFILGMIIIKGSTPSIGFFLVIFLIFTGTMIVLLSDEFANNQKVSLFSFMHEYCVLLLLERGEKRKPLVLDDLIKGFLNK